MMGNISYSDMLNYAQTLTQSSEALLQLISQYNDTLFDDVKEFCNQIQSYSRFLTSSVELYKASDDALKTMIEKNK